MSDRAYAKVQAQQKTLIGSLPKSSFLQRTCACGGSPGIDGLCTECRDKRLTLQSSRRGIEAPSVSAAAQGNAPAQENVTSSSAVVERASRFGHDFSRIPVYYSPRQTVIQTKLQVNQPGDVYEQAADQVAEQVMCTTDLQTSVSDDEDETKNFLTRKQSAEPGANSATGPSDVPPIVHAVLNSGEGQPLDTTTRAFMEPHFGHDFSQVRVHTDERAAESARSVHALAYTVGSHIVFGAGQYVPNTTSGRRLLAHELTHTIQQQETARIQRAPAATAGRDKKLDEIIGRVQQALAGTPSTKEEKRSSQVLHTVLANLLAIKGASTEDQVQHAKLSIVAAIQQYFGETKQPMKLQRKAFGLSEENRFEREAEVVAGRVVQGKSAGDINQGPPGVIQRQGWEEIAGIGAGIGWIAARFGPEIDETLEEAGPYVKIALAAAYTYAAGNLFSSLSEHIISIVFSEEKEAGGKTIKVRKLKDSEVKTKESDEGVPFEQEKKKHGYPPNADIYVDKDGNYWIGRPDSDHVEPFP